MKKSIFSLPIIVLLLFIIHILAGPTKEKARLDLAYLEQNGNFAIGEILGKDTNHLRKGRGGRCRHVFYEDNGRRVLSSFKTSYIEMISDEAYDRLGKTKKGERYLVVYDSGGEHGSFIYLDKPIKDSLDFEKYVESFMRLRFEDNNQCSE